MRKLFAYFVAALLVAASYNAFALKIPEDHSHVEFFYIFGPDGSHHMGSEDHELTLYIDIPENEFEKVSIAVFDPDTGGKKDWPARSQNRWNTVTKFSIYGDVLLDEKEFAKDNDYAYYTFGPYAKTKGQKIDTGYRFKVVAQGIKGDDANLFKFKISPDSAEVFSHNITFRLASDYGDKMYFYPAIGKGVRKITVENYDLDEDGGTSVLYDTADWGSLRNFLDFSSRGKYNINDSETGTWSATEIDLAKGPARRLEYVITKKTQRYAHAGLKITDDKGNPVPIYFRKGRNPAKITARPKALKPSTSTRRCDTFTFDATGSYDPDRQNLEFLWNFGDSESSTEPVVTHTYKKGGEYTVTLTVVDNSGLACDTAITSQVVKVNTPPKAAMSIPKATCAGDSIVLDASRTSDDTPDTLSYTWDLGDGTQAQGKRVTKQYTKSGDYIVRLEVDDNSDSNCRLDSTSKTIHVNVPPVANAGKDVDMCLDSFDEKFNIVFDASKSYDPDDDVLQYRWDFGDGASGKGRRVTHLYKKSGVYEAELSLSDPASEACGFARDTVVVSLNKRPGAEAGSDKKVCLGEAINLRGRAGAKNSDHLDFTWDLGDGETRKGKKVAYTYKKSGKYRVLLSIDDKKGTPCSLSTDVVQVDVNSPPQATLQEAKAQCVGSRISFDASASYDADESNLKYIWDFGDGAVEKGGSHVSHTYLSGGIYSVEVVVDDGRGSECSRSRDITICKVNTPPVADAGPNLVCCEGKKARFDGSKSYDPDGDPLEYEWDFGDGTKGEGAEFIHTYEKRGTYDVVLTVDDGSGTTCSKSQTGFTATVNAMPVPVIKVR